MTLVSRLRDAIARVIADASSEDNQFALNAVINDVEALQNRESDRGRLAHRDDLKAEQLRRIVSYNPETGIFHWLQNRGGQPAGGVAGCARKSLKKPDILLCIRKKKYLAHRLAWLYVYGSFPKGDIDHINGDPADNRISNLRDVSHRTNMENRKGAQANNKLGKLGVSLDGRGRIRATIQIDGKQKHLGNFPNTEDAHQAYLTAKRELHVGNTL